MIRNLIIGAALFLSALAGPAASQSIPGMAYDLGSSPCTTAYVTGDRRGTITATSSGIAINGGTTPALVDGNFSTVAGPLGSLFFASASPSAGAYIMFDFGAGNSKLVTEAKFYQDLTTSQATYHWCGSNDATTCALQIGADFVLGGTATQTQTQLNGNSTSYRAYGLFYVSGSNSSSSWEEEMEFKQCP